ncbi:hypothetical protein Tco_0539795 [Tanacetum coccineum]
MKIMPPRMRTRSAGQPVAESRGRGTGERVGRGKRGRHRRGNDEHVDELNGQKNDQGLGANGNILRDRNWKLRIEHSRRLLASIFGLLSGRRVTCEYLWSELEGKWNWIDPRAIEKMTIKEVKGESVMEWKTKVTTKEGVVIQFPGNFRGYESASEEEVEEKEGLKKVWEKMEYVISDSDSDLKSTARLTNAPAVFVDLMKRVCNRSWLVLSSYSLMTLLGYSKSKEEHEVLLSSVGVTGEGETLQKVLETRLGLGLLSILKRMDKVNSSLTGPELVLEKSDKVVLIKEKLKAARDLQKSYADKRHKPLEFEHQDNGGPLRSLKDWPFSYRLRLHEELSSVHDTFHVSNLNKCLVDASLHVSLDEIKVNKTLRFVEEPIEIMK